MPTIAQLLTCTNTYTYMGAHCNLHCVVVVECIYVRVYECVWYVWCCTVHNYVEVHCVCVHVYSTLCLCTCVPNVEDSGDAGVCMFVLTWVSYEDYIGLHGWNNPSSA